MMQRSIVLPFAAAVTISLTMAGCGALDQPAESAATYMAADGTCAAEPIAGVDFEAAQEVMTTFETTESTIPDTTPLPADIPDGTTAVYLDNGSPVAAIFSEYLAVASEAAGIEFTSVDTGSDAQSINSAMNSVVDMQPDIVFDMSVDAVYFQDQLAALQAGGTTIVYGGQTNAEELGLPDSLGGVGHSEVNSEVLAAAAIALTCGTATEFVWYNIPELPASNLQTDIVIDTIKAYCAECEVRSVDISLTDPSPADAIVSDLQSNPQTQFFISMGDQLQLGLREKAELAGLTNAYGIGQSSLPANLEQIASGQQAAGFAVDFQLSMWLYVDEGLRRMLGGEPAYSDNWEGYAREISRVITPTNVETFLDPTYSPVPDLENQFKQIWRR